MEAVIVLVLVLAAIFAPRLLSVAGLLIGALFMKEPTRILAVSWAGFWIGLLVSGVCIFFALVQLLEVLR